MKILDYSIDPFTKPFFRPLFRKSPRPEAPDSDAYTARNLSIHLWGIGAMADYMLFVAFNALILPIFTTGFMMDPRWVGWALTLPRIFDALIDPVLGHFTDNFHSRWGRRRPFLVISALLGGAMLILMWWVPKQWPAVAQFIWLLVTSILLYFSYGLFTMTHQALGYELSDDYHKRSKVMAVRGFYFSIAAMAGGGLYLLCLNPVFGGEINGVRWLSVGMTAVILAATAIVVTNSSERFQNVNRQHVPLLPAIRATLRIRPFVIVLLLRVAQTLSTSLYGSIGFFIGAYYVCGGDKAGYSKLSFWCGIVGFATAIALVPLSTWISRHVGKRQSIIWGLGLVFVAALAMPWLHIPGRPYLMLSYMIGVGILVSGVNLFLASVMPDICDIDELTSGQRREGLFSAVMSFVGKIENSACILISSYMITWAGFDIKLGPHQPPEVLNKLLLYGFAPKMLFSGVAFLIALYFPINQKLMNEVRAKLAARRAGNTPT
jgi:GPH family glycoside/pentoside/hexuronide:cation symporter